VAAGARAFRPARAGEDLEHDRLGLNRFGIPKSVWV
jgi:hypothetical protein